MTKEVNAGPVPLDDRDILKFRDGDCSLIAAFLWDRSAQGGGYWANLSHNGDHDPMYTDLPDEAKAIIDAWCEELEGQGND